MNQVVSIDKRADIETLQTFLTTCISLVDELGKIHDIPAVHGCICPKNLVIDKDNQCVIIVKPEGGYLQQGTTTTHFNEEQLTYISPEQTGKVNRQPDHRTDLYSLGIVLYEMLTGKVPFSSPEPLELT